MNEETLRIKLKNSWFSEDEINLLFQKFGIGQKPKTHPELMAIYGCSDKLMKKKVNNALELLKENDLFHPFMGLACENL